jgi:hypothetical protein
MAASTVAPPVSPDFVEAPRMKRSLLATLVALAALSAPVAAQGVPLTRFGIMGGWATPYGTVKDYAKSGWDAGVTLAIGAPLVPVSFRLDGSYATMPGKPQLGGTVTPTFNIWSATGNIVWNIIGNTLPTKVYLIGGIGYYNVQQTIAVTGVPPLPTSSAGKFGYNAGLGVRFTKFFVEARWNDIQSGLDLTAYGKGTTNLEMIPINVGILF